MQLGSLGGIVFETSTRRIQNITGFSVSSSARYEDHDVPGTKQMTEYVGCDLREFSLSMSLRTDLGADIRGCLQALQSYINEGSVVRLTIGKNNLGRVTVRSVSETWQRLDPRSGEISAVDLSVTLREYV